MSHPIGIIIDMNNADAHLTETTTDTAATASVDAIKVNEPLPGQRASIEPYMRAADLCFRFGQEGDGIRRLRQAYGIAPEDPRVREGLASHAVDLDATTAVPPGP